MEVQVFGKVEEIRMKLRKNRQIPLFSTINKDDRELSPEIQHIIIRRITEDLNSVKEELQKIVHSSIEKEMQSEKEEAHNCLNNLESHLPGLKNSRPDCSKYDSYVEMIKPHLEFVKRRIDKGNSYRENVGEVMPKLATMEKRISKSGATLDFLAKLDEGSISRDLKSLKQGIQNIESTFKEYFPSFKRTKEEIDDLYKRLQLYERELKELMTPNHEWEEILTSLPYPTSNPDEFREVRKAVGRRCKRCGVEERY